jgi:hypothetical protein
MLGDVGWVVVRQNVHGSRFEVASFATRAEAEELIDRFESGYPHHQTYYVEPSKAGEVDG